MSTVPPSGPTGPQPDLPPRRSPSPQNQGEASPFASPRAAGQAPLPATGDPTGGLIPYRNVPALIAYYLAVFSMIPCVGLLLGVPAFVLGIVGLQVAGKNPAARGKVHAWVGIILGGLMTLLWGAAWAAMLLGAVRGSSVHAAPIGG